ncbi:MULTISPECIES: neuraminidase-like domain-containing protein [unclassified Pseudomonas]|uniref:Tc toxin subunit A-related protein n=1 Tax=unclassified Pseudomonas TaxID=196821 RepID=UPI000CD22F62|nr:MULTISPECIES: neuraminidase-like domain-containing protein [unclassified Pseudomonas]POA34464.1 insecticidal toxin complex protein TcaB2 [Pseudomonas sp. GW456-R21]POA70534.1 insecticidal toxin complex protein TcaB2 [Pseudomonas sp. GW460-R15]
MENSKIAGLLEQRRTALLEYCIGQVRKGSAPADDKFYFLRTPADLLELLRMDPLDSYSVQSSWVAQAISCAQQFIHAAYRKLEPGYSDCEFDRRDLQIWELYNNYPDWAALMMIALYPENFITPYVRRRKTNLFKTLENNLNQTHLSTDSVQVALQEYLQEFEQICNLDVISCYMDGTSLTQSLTPTKADYYLVARQRIQPFQYFWRKAEVELTSSSRAINPAAWREWQPLEIPVGDKVLDIRLVFWGGRLCVVWGEWREGIAASVDFLPPVLPKLEIKLAFMAQNGHWSAPFLLHSEDQNTDVSLGSRLIATVLVDEQHPKGKLGVLLTNRNRKGETPPVVPIDVYRTRDVLFRSIDDGTGWLDAVADYRFLTPETVQHPILPGSRPDVTESLELAGTLTNYYSLEAMVFRGFDTDSKPLDVLFVRGVCAAKTGLGGLADGRFDLSFLNPVGDDPESITGSYSDAGGWTTEWMLIERPAGGFVGNFEFSFGGSTPTQSYGRNKYKVVKVVANAAFIPPSLDKTNAQGAQFLTLNLPEPYLKQVRLNSLIGPDLVQRANISVDAVLDWETQHLKEPGPAAGPIDEPNGPFDGANGLFFWELFFHLPHLVASRLNAENRFLEAQQWLHYLFDPQAPVDSTTDPHKPLYWRCRPLTGPGNPGWEAEAATDPDAIGYSEPRHFRIVAFTEYVKNLIAWGDWYYRQLTRDSLVAARLCYVQAEFLMGKPPTGRTVNRWTTKTVGQLLADTSSRPALEAFEKKLAFTLADVPAKAEVAPMLGMLGIKGFELPINEPLFELFDLSGTRLSNLRNNLTIDGKTLDIPLFSPPTDPKRLLQDLAAGGAGSPRPMGGQVQVVGFRWRVMFEAALRAVQTLQDYGNQILRLLEQRDRAAMETLRHSHLLDLGAYAQTLQEQIIEQMTASVAALTQSKAMATERAVAYEAKVVSNVSAAEYEVMDALLLAKIFNGVGTGFKAAGAVAKTVVPNKAGTSYGVANPGGMLEGIGSAFDTVAAVHSLQAERTATNETYRRRRGEWELQGQQARAEERALTEQITAQNHAVEAARANLRQTLRANAHALTLYTFIKKRATNAELFGWLLGQLKALHYQAHDAVVSLCRSAQASLSFETGDYDSQILLPQVWQDEHHGLTAGEHLRVHLLRMEHEYLHRHERRLELVKTISLRQLFNDKDVDPQEGFKSWEDALAELQRTGTLDFKLTQLLFDRDHPGHYCRQIGRLDVDIPALIGPHENIKATLLQVSSITATKASTRSVEYLHNLEKIAPADVRFNLRSGQKIALSVGIGDTGMITVKSDEGLLNPFECTGAVSRWTLHFPWPLKEPQQSMLASLTDIILRVHYTAKVGDPTFTRKVEDLVNRVDW